MAKYPTLLATLPTISTRDEIGTALVRNMVTEMLALQQDCHNAIGTFSTLASYLSVSFKDDRTIKPSQVSHGKLASVSASQHHNKIHGSAHKTSDPIRLSIDGGVIQKGLMIAQQVNRIKSCNTNANCAKVTQANYTGQGYDSAWVTNIKLDYTPIFNIIMDSTAVVYTFRTSTRNIGLNHIAGYHVSKANVSTISNGIKVRYGQKNTNMAYKSWNIAKPN